MKLLKIKILLNHYKIKLHQYHLIKLNKMAANYLLLTPCCVGSLPLKFITNGIVPGVYNYTGILVQDSFGNDLVPNQCYTASLPAQPPLGLINAPLLATFTLVSGGCGDTANCGCIASPCQCSTAINLATVAAQLRYIDCNGNIQLTEILNPGDRSLKYCVKQWLTGGDILDYGACIDGACPTPPCYTLYSCDGSIIPFNSVSDLSLYSNTGVSVTLVEYPDICFLVYDNISSNCLDPQVVTFNAMGVDCCASTCYYVNTGSITYVSADLIVDAIGPLKFCSDIYPVVDALNGSTVTTFGACIDELCPQSCYVLTDCDGLADPIYTTSESVLPFLGTGAAFHINGYTNCWTVTTSKEDCACAINIVITTTYVDCATCAGYTSYKLTDCANSANVMYTSTDLSVYVNQVIEQACPGCWYVEEFFLQPPSNTAIVVTNSFINCTTCEQTYYLLTDCTSVEPDIITTTDLSANIGDVITLDWCPETCWQVSETRNHTSSTVVFLKGAYITCDECLIDVLPCTCQTVKLINPCVYYNINVPILFVGVITYTDCLGVIHDINIPQHKNEITIPFCGSKNQQFNIPYTVIDNVNCNMLSWIDCNGIIQTSRSGMLLNEISPKTCVKKWLMPQDQYEYTIYGDCTNVDKTFNCPVVPEIVRTVRPGYNTPTCTIDHYEEIVCSFADAMYSNALEKRYGITSCCPEDREKWELKYELINLATLVNPDYTCVSSGTCCDTPISSSSGTCNNQ